MAVTKTAAQAINEVYLRATGKVSNFTITDTKGVKILALLNHFQDEWAEEDWTSMYTLFTLADAVTATDTFALLPAIHHISEQEGDFVRINHTDGVRETPYTVVKITKLYNDGPIVRAGGNLIANAAGTVAQKGQNLIFSRAFVATDPQFGGSIKVPGYAKPATLSANTDVLSVDNPKWLIARVAAEYVRNDVTRVQLYDSLLGEAGQEWDKMKAANNVVQSDEVYTGGWNPMPGVGGAFD